MMLTTLSTAATHWHGTWGGGFHVLFLVIPLFWIALIVVFAIVFGRRRRAAWRWGGPSRSAEQTLAERFANGDIDEVEYRARLEVLPANSVPPSR